MAVRISPQTLTVNTGAPFAFTAQALDAGGRVVPNTPIVFVLSDPTKGTINAATGAGTAGSARGTTSVTAQLLTGPTDNATLTIVSPPASIAAVSGGGQTANVNATLTSPVVVKVTATDGGPAAGVAVAFAAQNGGTVGAASATTGSDGTAQTTWKLGPAPGPQTLTAAATGLTGSPVTFTATANALPPVRLDVLTQPPASVAAGTAFGLVVRALDATGALAPTFTGPVTLALGAGAPSGALLTGTTTATAVAGVATFTDLKLNVPGTYTLASTAPSLTGAATASFSVTAGAAAKLVFQNYPILGATAGATFDDITVSVRDALNNPVTTFTGAVSITAVGPVAIVDSAGASAAAGDVARAPTAPAHALIGTTTVNAVGGVATFSGLKLTAAGTYTLSATSGSLTAAAGPAFAIAAGPASTLSLVSGGGQSVAGGIAFPNPIVVKVGDAFGNGVGGVTVSFTPVGGTGTAFPATATSSAGTGLAQTSWTPIGIAGLKTLNVTGTGLLPSPLAVTGTATSASGTARVWNGTTSTDWGTASNWTPSGVPGAADPITVAAGTPNAPLISVPSTIASLTIASGAQVTNNSTLTVSGSLTSGGGYDVIVGSGSVVLNGASGSLAASIHGTVAVTVNNGAYTLAGFTEAYGPFTIASSAKVEVANQELKLHGNLVTSTGGKLAMTNAAGYITVYGTATFGGGATTGLMTAGTAYFVGAFSATGAAYATSGSHVSQFIGNSASTQAIAYSPTAGTSMAAVQFSGSDAKVLSGAPAFGNVTLASTSAQVSGVGVTATISGNFVDNTSVFGTTGGWIVANTIIAGSNAVIDTDFITTNLLITGTAHPYGGTCGQLRSDVARFGGARDRIAGFRAAVVPGASTQTDAALPFGSLSGAQYVQVSGNVTVSGASAMLTMNGGHMTIIGAFSTASGGRIDMTQSCDYLVVLGSATFAGGSTAGLLTAGTLEVIGNITEGGGAVDAFAPAQAFYTYIGDYYAYGGVRAPSPIRRATGGTRIDRTMADLRDRLAVSDGMRRRAQLMPAARAAAMRAARAQADLRKAALAAARAEEAARAEAVHAARLRAADAHRAEQASRRASLDRMAQAYARRGLAVPTRAQLLANASAATQVGRGGTLANFSATPVITFAHPTTSFFGNLYIEGGNITVNSNVLVMGRLETGNSFSFGAGSPSGFTITSHGADIRHLDFDNVRWVLLDGNTVYAMDYIGFRNMDPTVDQFTLVRSGDELVPCDCSPPYDHQYQLWGWTFYSAPTTGRYYRATDTNAPTTPFVLALDAGSEVFANSNYYSAPGMRFAATVPGATWPATQTWTGASGTGWTTPGNWADGNLPLPFDDIVVPSGASNDADLAGNVYVRNLTIGNGRHVTTSCTAFLVLGDVSAPTSAPGTLECDGDAVTLIGGTSTAPRTVTGNFDAVDVWGYYKVSGQVIVNDYMTVYGNVTLNGGRLDIGGVGGTGWGSFYTYSTGTLTMNNAADQMFVGTGGAWFEGGSTAGLLTAGTITLVSSAFYNSCLHSISGYGAPDAFAPSGTHKVVFTGPVAHPASVEFYDPAQSFLNNADIAAGSGMAIGSIVNVNGTLARSGTGAVLITTTYNPNLLLTVSGLSFSSAGATTVTNVLLALVNGTSNATFDNVAWTGFTNANGGALFTVNRTGGPFTFNGFNFSGAGFSASSTEHFVTNAGAANISILGATPSSGILNTHFLKSGSGTVTWP
ncbi:MAG: hypothetical protein U9Q74_00290 [Gemmatimonadota bacterium]|nr:hypothetical protein [Gemmatimonadota bacterium]